MSKKINRQLLQDILAKGDGVKTVASEAVDWVISVAEEAAKNLAASGRRTPGGRLMAPRMDAGLMVRHLAKDPGSIAGVALEKPAAAADTGEGRPEWDEYHDWQQQVRQGKTRLSYEEWKAERAKEMAETEMADKAERQARGGRG